ncbi:MAG: alpha-hydroxy acid oxidase [Steroidobacteraceae bacterium]
MHEHRGAARGGPPARAARDLRVRRPRRLRRGDAASQPRRVRRHRAAPARDDRHLASPSPPPCWASRGACRWRLRPPGSRACSTATARSRVRSRPRPAACPSRSAPCRSARSRTCAPRPASRSGSSSTCSRTAASTRRWSRARAPRARALILTADLVLQGVRRRDAHNGLTIPPRLTLANALDSMTKPAWAFGVLFGKRRTFGNLAGRVEASGGLGTLSQWIASQSDSSITWKQIDWLRSVWPGKIIVKGILDVEDAKLAAASGVDALVVSNHGGRQLDGAAASIHVLPEVVEAVAGRCEVLFDGGIQCGQDVLKALACGARCLVGKSFLYGLAAGGRAGVTRMFELLRNELEVSMALAGVTDVRQVDRNVLRRR